MAERNDPELTIGRFVTKRHVSGHFEQGNREYEHCGDKLLTEFIH